MAASAQPDYRLSEVHSRMTTILTTTPPYSGGLPRTEWCPNPEKIRLGALRTRDALLGRQVLYHELKYERTAGAAGSRVADGIDANPDANPRETRRTAAHMPSQ